MDKPLEDNYTVFMVLLIYLLACLLTARLGSMGIRK